MGRMALNILVTFERSSRRERIGERIRDIGRGPLRKRGKWMGGLTPLGYEVRDRKLLIHDTDAEQVQSDFPAVRPAKVRNPFLARELVAAGERNRYGRLLDKGVLSTPYSAASVYIGEAFHKGCMRLPANTRRSSIRELWDQVPCYSHGELLQTRRQCPARRHPSPSEGLLFGPDRAAIPHPAKIWPQALLFPAT